MGSRLTVGAENVYGLLVTGSKSITVAPVDIHTADGNYCKVMLTNTNTNVTIYVGSSTSISTTTGFPILPETTVTLPYYGDLSGMVQTTTSLLHYLILKR